MHKDLARIEVNGTPYTFSVDEGQHKFTKPESPFFIVQPDPPNPPNIKKLTDPDADNVPTGGWVLFYKTDVKVESGAAKKDYTIRLIDKKGLASDIVNASTKPNKPETELVSITKGEKIPGSGSGSSDTDPIIISTDGDKAEIRIASATANTTVHCTRTDTGTSIPYDGNPVTVPLPLNGAGEKKYKLEYYTDGEGFAATPVKTIYYKVVKTYNVTFRVEIVDGKAGGKIKADSGSFVENGSTSVEYGGSVTFTADPTNTDWEVAEWSSNVGNISFDKKQATLSNVTADTIVTVKFYQSTLKNPATWKDLARAVKSAPDNATLTIDGEIKATSGTGNNGEIVINKNLTIKKATGASSAVIDANKDTGSKPKHRIFKVESGNTLTLENLTLKNGMAEGSDGPGDGGAIYVHGASVKITGCTLTDNTANKNGGAVYATKRDDNAAHVTISGGSINGNTVTINSGFGGGIYINDGCELTLKDNVTVKDNKAARGGGVRANKSTVTMNGCTFEGNKSTHGDASNGCGGVYVNGGTVTMQSCTLKSNDGKVRAGGLLVEGGAKVTMDGCTITGNTATTGGGIYITGGSSIVTLNNGVQIKDNTATTGGGVYVQDGTFKMSGSAIVTPSTGSDQYTPGKNDVYLESGKMITVDSTLSNNPAARITPREYTADHLYLTGSGVGTHHLKFTVPPQKVTENSENWNVFWYIAADGTLKAEVEDSSLLQEVIRSRPNDTPFIIKLGNIGDLQTVEIPGNKKIMLKADRDVTLTCPNNGHDHYKHLQVQRDATLILEGKIKLQGADYGDKDHYALYVEDGGKAEIKDGVTITGFENTGRGTVFVDGNLTMSGGTITGNKARNKGDGTAYDDGKGGGVYIAPDRSFTMTGGTIADNEAGNGGGVYVSADGPQGIYGNFIMKGGTIKNNKATVSSVYSYIEYTGHGGGVCTQGNFEMRGGTITGNQSAKNCKAVQLEHDFYWKGGDIKDNGGANQTVSGIRAVADRNGGLYYFHNNTHPRKEPS